MTILTFLGNAELVICLAAFCVLLAKGLWKDYWALGSFLAVRLAAEIALTVLSHSTVRLGRSTAYHAYFWVYWVAFAVESVLALFIVFGVFRLTIRPLRGLLKVGTILFFATAALSMVWALASAAGLSSGSRSFIAAVSQLQRSQSLLTLGTLLFVFLAMRLVGVSSRSKMFGVGLGLGALAINDLAQSAWLSRPNTSIAHNVVNAVVLCAILLLWTTYFALPEPARREIDVDSPLSRWNRRCLAWNWM